MQLKLFMVPVKNVNAAEAELNAFLRGHRVLAVSSLLTFVVGAEWVPAQTALHLDLQPAFDFGDDPAADPFFAPATLGLTNGMAGFDQASALSAFAATAGAAFPPSHEVFLAYWGNPRYALPAAATAWPVIAPPYQSSSTQA